MSELTDLEICKRIAEIEGIEFRIQNRKVLPESPAETNIAKMTDVYNPLTDDALCFGLVKKYGVEIIPQWDRVSANNGIECAHEYAKNPNKAICLAIIGANKDKL